MRDRRPLSIALPVALSLMVVASCGQEAATTGSALTETTAASIWIDASKTAAGNPHFWSASVGTGTASLALRGDLQTHYKIGQREAGFQRVRGHGVLNDDMGIYRGPGTYDWTNFDRYLSAISAAGMRPIMEMDFMPSALALRGHKHDIYKDAGDYRRFIAAVVRHCVQRFGLDEVSQWYWEIWNEPDYVGFWNGRNPLEDANVRMNDYNDLYDNAVAAITSVIPNALVGGPAATNPGPLAAFLQHCKQAGTRVTFVSSHHYPGGTGAGEWVDAGDLVSDNQARVDAITGAGFSPSEVQSFNTEWNSSYNGQGGGTGDALLSMDNHWNVGFILRAAKLLADQNSGDTPPLGLFSFWALSDIFDESIGPSGSYILAHDAGNLPFGSVFGLITAQGVRKATFNAFKMLNRLGPTRLQSSGGTSNDGIDAMATTSRAGDEIQILVYDQYRKLDTTGTDTVTVNLYNVPAALTGKPLFVTRFIVDENHSNPYDVWQRQGQPPSPSEQQWRAIRAAQHLSAEPLGQTTITGSYTTTLPIKRQSGTLLVLGVNRPLMGRDAFAPIEGEDWDGQAGASRMDGDDVDLGQMAMVAAGGSTFYDAVDFSDAGVDSVQLRTQTPAGTNVQLHLDAADGPSIGTCAIAPSGRGWATTSCPLAHTSGVHHLYLSFAGAANLNWMQFSRGGG